MKIKQNISNYFHEKYDGTDSSFPKSLFKKKEINKD